MKREVKRLLNKKLTRREFIKKSLVGLAGAGIAFYTLDSLVKNKVFGKFSYEKGPEKLWKWSKEAYHYTKLGENVQCNICPNRCILGEGERSFCRVKTNKGGKLYTLVYGNPCAVHVDPIEKKPLFHFLPGTKAFSIATAGCNFRCLNCQNWQISQSKPEETRNYELFPKDVVKGAKQYGCESIAYTYSEPVAFYEYMYDTAKEAKHEGLRNLWITNGYINREALLDLSQYLDAANVDIKNFKEEIYNTLNGGHLKPVLETVKTLKERKVWFELTNLVIPNYTDDMEMIEEMCKWIVKNLGPSYPLHFSRFYPMYKLKLLPPTPVDTLERAAKIAEDCGMEYVYIGNVPGHVKESTFCPDCKRILIERKGYKILQNNIQNGACKFCGKEIAGVWS